MLFLPTVHLSCSPDTRALFNNLFFFALINFATACRQHGREHTGTQAASGPCRAEQRHLRALSPGQEDPETAAIPSGAR